MDWLADAIAVLALVVAGLAFIRAGRADKRDAARHHAERTPELALVWEMQPLGRSFLRLTNLTTSIDLDRVEIEALPVAHPLFDKPRVPYIDSGIRGLRAGESGEVHTPMIDNRFERVTLRCTCHAGDEQWVVTVGADLPPPGQRYRR